MLWPSSYFRQSSHYRPVSFQSRMQHCYLSDDSTAACIAGIRGIGDGGGGADKPHPYPIRRRIRASCAAGPAPSRLNHVGGASAVK